MRVSHETIYTSLFVQARGALRGELTGCLRTGRVRRRPQRRVLFPPQRIRDKVMISQRPVEAADRVVAGHWEGDLMVGKHNKSFVGTLVERTTRFVVLLHLPSGPATTRSSPPGRQDRPAPGPAAPLGHLGPRHRDGQPHTLHP